jgi:tetratricopeptide (TPR) repeat protein
MEDLGLMYHRKRSYDQAEPYLRRALELYRQQIGAQSLLTRRTEVLLGDVLRRRGQFDDAEPLLLGGFEALYRRRVSGFEFALRIAVASLVELYDARDRPEEAARFRAILPEASRTVR